MLNYESHMASETEAERKARYAAHSRRYRKLHPDRVKATAKRSYAKRRLNPDNIEKDRASNRRRYGEIKLDAALVSRLNLRRRCRERGISEDQFNAMVMAQNGKCAICQSENDLNIDHNHGTGHVRGLLCSPCNQGLGFFRDSSTLLANAQHYLAGHGLE